LENTVVTIKDSKNYNPISVQEFLSEVEYPATTDDLIKAAHGNDAPLQIVEAIKDLPDKEFDSPVEVSEALGQFLQEEEDEEEHEDLDYEVE
jgi:hypothetical protein